MDVDTSPPCDLGQHRSFPEGNDECSLLGNQVRPGTEQPDSEPWVPWDPGVEKIHS